MIGKIRKSLAWTMVLCFLVAAGCYDEFMTGSRVVPQQQPVVQRAGPKATIAVLEITNNTGVQNQVAGTGTTIRTGSSSGPIERTTTIRDPIGTGMRDQLITALTQTGRFTVLLDTTVSSPQYFIEGAVTEYEASETGVAGGVGWGIPTRRRVAPRMSDPTINSSGGVFSEILAPKAIGGLFEQDHVAVNIHLVDAGTGAIIASTAIEAKPKDLGVATNLLFGGGSKIADFGGQTRTPIQKAIRACMIKAAVWAANNVTVGPVAQVQTQ